jgi:hypothetical protein
MDGSILIQKDSLCNIFLKNLEQKEDLTTNFCFPPEIPSFTLTVSRLLCSQHCDFGCTTMVYEFPHHTNISTGTQTPDNFAKTQMMLKMA